MYTMYTLCEFTFLYKIILFRFLRYKIKFFVSCGFGLRAWQIYLEMWNWLRWCWCSWYSVMIWLTVKRSPFVSHNGDSPWLIKKLCVMCVCPIRNRLITIFPFLFSSGFSYVGIVFYFLEFGAQCNRLNNIFNHK